MSLFFDTRVEIQLHAGRQGEVDSDPGPLSRGALHPKQAPVGPHPLPHPDQAEPLLRSKRRRPINLTPRRVVGVLSCKMAISDTLH